QSCVALSPNNMCTVEGCQSDVDCGLNGAIQNHCEVSSTGSLCFRGCEADAGGPCRRTDFLCFTADGGTPSVCIPDCRQQPPGFCGYGTICDSNDGQCLTKTCTEDSNCPSGTVCVSNNSKLVCAPDCTRSGCPMGLACNSTSRGCNAAPS